MIALERRQQTYLDQPLRRPTAVDTAIIQSRDVFVAEEKGREKTLIAYEIDQDRIVYQELAKHKGEVGYKEAHESLNSYTKMQLETHIGERLHVGISKFQFRIDKEELVPKDSEESMLSMMKRGRDYRRDHGKPVDWARESAEVYGFEETQRVLTDEKTPEGTMMLSISPRGEVEKGSIYKQNFYDVYQKTKEGVTAYRFTSGLDRAESQQKVRQYDLRYARDAVATDAQFLARPIRLDPKTSPFKTPQEVHAYLHKEHAHMEQNEFARTIEACAPLITSYINTLCNNPDALAEHERNFRVLLNGADEVAGKIKNKEGVFEAKHGRKNTTGEVYVRPWIPTDHDIDRLAALPIRQVDTGCGPSGGKSMSSALSVVEFSGSARSVMSGGSSREPFNCPDCHYSTTQSIGNTCPGCGLTKEAFAERSGVKCD